MRQITINLNDVLFAELETAAARTEVRGFGPQHWAQEAVESALASRRLSRVTPGKLGARVVSPDVLELAEHRVLSPRPEMVAG